MICTGCKKEVENFVLRVGPMIGLCKECCELGTRKHLECCELELEFLERSANDRYNKENK